MAGGNEFTVFSEERGIVDHEEHRHRRLVHRNRRKGFRILDVGNGITDFKTVNAHDGTDVSALDLVHVGLAQAFEDHQLLDLGFLDDVVALAQGNGHARAQGTPGDAAHGDTSHIRGILQGRHQHLGCPFDDGRCRDLLQDGIQQRRDIVGLLFPVMGHPALLGRAVDGLEIQLVLIGAEVEHQFENLLLHLVGTAVGLVHLVDHHDRFLPHVDGLVQHETGLGHAAFKRIHQQEDAVGHIEDTLHLAPEIAMSRSIDNIDLHPFIGDGHVLGKDSDATLPFQVIVVQDKIAEIFGPAYKVGLIDHPVHEGGLSMVNMGNNGDVSDVLHNTFFCKNLQR